MKTEMNMNEIKTLKHPVKIAGGHRALKIAETITRE